MGGGRDYGYFGRITRRSPACSRRLTVQALRRVDARRGAAFTVTPFRSSNSRIACRKWKLTDDSSPGRSINSLSAASCASSIQNVYRCVGLTPDKVWQSAILVKATLPLPPCGTAPRLATCPRLGGTVLPLADQLVEVGNIDQDAAEHPAVRCPGSRDPNGGNRFSNDKLPS